jgi:hypothetical protein
MNATQFERTLRRTLRPVHPGDEFVDAVLGRIEGSPAPAQPAGRLAHAPRWLPVSLAACALAAVGLLHWQQASVARVRGIQARGQLLQALSIASTKVNTARAAVIREETSLN